jgi:lysine biosynthesis protein LysW
MNVKRKKISRCPSCGEKISIGERPKVGQYLLCSICDEKLEIVNLDPIVLDLLFDSNESEFNIDEYEYWEKYWNRV